MSESSTIYALSSGSGMAGIAVIRVSGPRAFAVAEALAGCLPPPRQAARRHFKHPEKDDLLDDGLLLTFPGPNSFTGEDVAEFHVHGSLAVLRSMLETLGSMTGLRPAEPGEFTLRAFRNDRMDLVAAEGLGDLIRARTEKQRVLALRHTVGEASQAIEGWRRELIAVMGRVEATVDFSDEGDVVDRALADVRARLDALIRKITHALADVEKAAPIREGVKVVLAGPPNAGKSSLLNALARREAAIVSAIPGTTRDVIEVSLDIAGIPVLLTDTAGMRPESQDEIERIGMERARREVSSGDILVWITAPDTDPVPPPQTDSEALWVENKSDLQPLAPRIGPAFRLSVLRGDGMADVMKAIEERVTRLAAQGESAILIRTRHKQIASACLHNLQQAAALAGGQPELVAECLRAAAHDLGRLTGRIDVEDVLEEIFREFCIGK